MVLSRLIPPMFAVFVASMAQLNPVAAADRDNGWTDREDAIWHELAEVYGAAEVSIARNMFPRASVDTYVYREAVYWLQDKQNTRLDRDRGNSYTGTFRER